MGVAWERGGECGGVGRLGDGGRGWRGGVGQG